MNYMFKGNDIVFQISSVLLSIFRLTPERFKISVLVGVLFGVMGGTVSKSVISLYISEGIALILCCCRPMSCVLCDCVNQGKGTAG